MKHKLLTCLGLASICIACTDEKLLPDIADVEVDYVTTTLTIGVSDEIPGTAEAKSRGVDDPGTVTDTKIIDLLVVQYNGTTDGAYLLGQPQYFKLGNNYHSNADLQDLTVKLAYADEPTSLVVIANVGEQLTVSNGSTLGELKTRCRSAENESGLFSHTSNDGDEHIMLNCIQTLEKIETGSEITCELKHNLARIHMTFRLKTDLNITINDFLAGNVAKSNFYLNDYDDFLNVSLSDQFFDYYLPNKEGQIDGEYTNYDYTFYVSPNMRGKTESGSEMGKNISTPYGATYVTMNATINGDSNNKDNYEYTFYLGENLTNDFNLKPNHAYDYVITFDDKGNPNMDSRIEDVSLLDYTLESWDRANCYILNPSKVIDRKFRIPVDRVDEFWGDKGYENVVDNCLQDYGQWQVEILWTDFDNSDNNFKITKNEGTGKNSYFEIEVKHSRKYGNALIGIKKTGVPHILWSWHLWITDYNPYKAADQKVIENQYEYPVTGGSVHRYGSNVWKTGICNNTFIMDRDLGATPIPEYPSLNISNFVYQFGRKDPFAVTNDVMLYNKENSNIEVQNCFKNITIEEATVSSSVQNPTIFYVYKSRWCAENKYYKNHWFDANLKNANQNLLAKSIFDPCPPKWRIVPAYAPDFWEVTATTWNNSKKYEEYGFEPPIIGNNYKIFSYWPSGGGVPLSGHIIYYMYAMRNADYTVKKSESFWWSSIGINETSSSGLDVYTNNSASAIGCFSASMSAGAYVRPVMMRAPVGN